MERLRRAQAALLSGERDAARALHRFKFQCPLSFVDDGDAWPGGAVPVAGEGAPRYTSGVSALPQVGDRLSGYVIAAQVARGGQGVVYAARREADGARVALKLLLDVEPEARERFEREALELARVEHPHVVRVHELGVFEAKPFIVMEWIEGQSLFERVRSGGPLEPEEATAVLGQVASALAACHAAGLVHRDVKPQNVVLAAERGAVLVDFGLVHVSEGGGSLAERLTETGAILGTPAYMAPEQADASFGAVSPASDVYALGATLYYALTGAAPLSTRGGLTAVLMRLLEEPPPDPRSLRPDLPPGLAALCLACLAKRPAARPPDAVAFAARLGAAPDAAPRRGRALLGALVAAGVVAAGALGATRSAPAAPPASPTAAAASSTPAPVPPAPAPTAAPVLSSWPAIRAELAARPDDVALLERGVAFLERGQDWRELHRVLRRLQTVTRELLQPEASLDWALRAGALAWRRANEGSDRRAWLALAIEGLRAAPWWFSLEHPWVGPKQKRVWSRRRS